MKISFNWIQQYTGKLEISAEDLASKIKGTLAEVEHIENLVEKYKDITIAEILEAKDHPNADKLGIYIINNGLRNDIQVVAGDKKLKKGDKVAYLQPESKIPNNPYPDKFDGIIKTTKLRGETSEGMLASEKELGISNNHENVLVLDTSCKVGDNFAETFKLNDYILDIENKPLTIRPDTFGIVGMAREVSGILHQQFVTPEWLANSKKFEPQKLDKEDLPLKVTNKLETLCPRYMAITMQNIQIEESPIWLKALLSSVGIKSINNVVDITNYLMTLTGQPLHAFDYDKLAEKDIHAKDKAFITVRTAKQGEKITTLDGKTVELQEKTVVICDSQNPIAIGGIMGGLDTEIDVNTKNIIIESANFDLYNIRKSSMALGIFTEASTRFSKGQDPNLCEPVLYKAIELVQELAGGAIAGNIQDEHIQLPTPHKLTFSIQNLNAHTGLSLTREQILDILHNIEIYELKSKDKDLLTLEIPTYRQDLKIPEDIHEEISRLYGYENIELTLPTRTIQSPKSNINIETNQIIRKILTSMGANEILTYNFVGEQLYKNCNLNLENNYRITNPISPELEYMRTSLIPSLLEKINQNVNNGYSEFAIYEINKVHNKLDREGDLPKEHRMLSLAFSKDTEFPFYNAKFLLDKLFNKLNTTTIFYDPIHKLNKENFSNSMNLALPVFDVNRTAVIYSEINKKKIFLGFIGEPNRDLVKHMKLKQGVGIFEINLDELQKIKDMKKEFMNYSKFPKIQQDFCFVLDKDIPYIILYKALESALKDRNLNYTIQPVDIYQKESEVKQITLNINIQHQEKTLKEKDILSLRKLLEKKVFKETKGVLKG